MPDPGALHRRPLDIGDRDESCATNARTSERNVIPSTSPDPPPVVIVLHASDRGSSRTARNHQRRNRRTRRAHRPRRKTPVGVPVALNQGLGAKVDLVIAETAVTVDHDGVVDVRWSDAVGTDFEEDAVRCRVEGRFGVSVNQPGAIVKISTQGVTWLRGRMIPTVRQGDWVRRAARRSWGWHSTGAEAVVIWPAITSSALITPGRRRRVGWLRDNRQETRMGSRR